jgi:hypothetical protein
LPPGRNQNSPEKRLARIAGVLYLLVGIFGGFAEGFVDPKMNDAGDAAATAANVVANAGLVRLGVVADLLDQTFFVFLAMTLYVLLKHVHKSVAMAMLVLVTLAAGIASLNTVFLFEGLQVATTGSYLAAFGTAGVHALVLLLLDIQHYGLLIAQIFFGLWLVPLGYLAYKSGMFPRWLGSVLIVGGVCYLGHSRRPVRLRGHSRRAFALGCSTRYRSTWCRCYLVPASACSTTSAPTTLNLKLCASWTLPVSRI